MHQFKVGLHHGKIARTVGIAYHALHRADTFASLALAALLIVNTNKAFLGKVTNFVPVARKRPSAFKTNPAPGYRDWETDRKSVV